MYQELAVDLRHRAVRLQIHPLWAMPTMTVKAHNALAHAHEGAGNTRGAVIACNAGLAALATVQPNNLYLRSCRMRLYTTIIMVTR